MTDKTKTSNGFLQIEIYDTKQNLMSLSEQEGVLLCIKQKGAKSNNLGDLNL